MSDLYNLRLTPFNPRSDLYNLRLTPFNPRLTSFNPLSSLGVF